MAIFGFEAQTWKGALLQGHVVALGAAAYSFWMLPLLPCGLPRWLACTPVLALYAALPFVFNRDTHLVGVACFYCILTWIASFKVLLWCWDRGPGREAWAASSFPRFAIVMTYPVHVKQAGKEVKRVPVECVSWLDLVTKSEEWYMLVVRSVGKTVALAGVLQLLSRRGELDLPMVVVHLLLSVQLYLFSTIVLEVLAAVANFLFGVTIEPHFDNPFAAVSLGEFWGRRWNLLVSNCIRETVYNPALCLLGSSEKAQQFGVSESGDSGVREKGGRAGLGFDSPRLVAMLAAFLVSGLAHELLVYYVTLRVTWEMMSFFVVQGIAVALEAAWKVHYPNTRPPRLLARILTLSFAFITAHWLFWPPLDSTSEQVGLEMQKMLAWEHLLPDKNNATSDATQAKP